MGAEGWLPDPELVIGWYETPVETRVGPQEWSLGIRQRIPFPTKLSKQTDIADVEARQAVIAYEREVRDVLVEVVRSAYELQYIDEAIRVSGEIVPLVERYVAASADETASTLPELFRAQSQRAQLENDRVLLTELRAVEAAKLLAQLALPQSTPLATPKVPEPPSLAVPLDALLRTAEQYNHDLLDSALAVELARAHLELEKDRRLPDLSLGVTRIQTDRLDSRLGMDPSDNGKDPVMVQLGVTLPIWVQRDDAAIRGARQRELAAAHRRAALIEELRANVVRAAFDVSNAERVERLYAEVLIPQAQAAARTAEDLLAAGKGSLGGALETIAVVHNFRLAAARARADRGRAAATLGRLLGRPLDSVQSEAEVK